MTKNLLSVLALSTCISGCASASAGDAYEHNDPLEGFNRPMFTFNYNLDKYVLKPAARGYRYITPEFVQDRVISAFENLKEPATSVNYILQGEPLKALTSAGRFLVNSTLGLAGTFDVATGWGWKLDRTGFDDTLATWCVPMGPYLVLPLMGSTTPRGAVATLADSFADPAYWATENHEDGYLAYAGYNLAEAIVYREATMDFTEDLEKNSVDLYTTVRSAYMQNKNKGLCKFGSTPETNSYDFDFDVEE